MAMATSWRTFHHDGKSSLSWWGWRVHAHPLSNIYLKVVVYALAERADSLPLFLLYPYMYFVAVPYHEDNRIVLWERDFVDGDLWECERKQCFCYYLWKTIKEIVSVGAKYSAEVSWTIYQKRLLCCLVFICSFMQGQKTWSRLLSKLDQRK